MQSTPRTNLALLALFALAPGLSLANEPEEEAPKELSKKESREVVIEILKKMEASYEKNLKEMDDYAFHKEVQRFEWQKKTLRPADKELYFVFFSEEYGQFQSRLLERNGQKVSERKKKRHDRKQAKSLAARKERREEREAQKAGTAPAKKKKKRRNLEITDPEVLKYLSFERVGEEEYEGQTAEVIRFSPDLSVPVDQEADNPAVKLLRFAEGEIWVDKESRQLLKLSYRLTEKVKPVALLKLKSLSFDLEMTKVDGKYWFPRSTETHIEARFVLFKISEHRAERQYDFKRFQVVEEEILFE